jgi:hypothetical protein
MARGEKPSWKMLIITPSPPTPDQGRMHQGLSITQPDPACGHLEGQLY